MNINSEFCQKNDRKSSRKEKRTAEKTHAVRARFGASGGMRIRMAAAGSYAGQIEGGRIGRVGGFLFLGEAG